MADQDEDLVQTKASKTLIIRHLPAELTKDEKEDLLKYFGAVAVRVFSDKGVLKHTAFASFGSEKSAEKALSRLHQLKILNHTLVVEFAKEQEHVTILKDPPVSGSVTDTKQVKGRKPERQDTPLLEPGVAPDLGLKFQTNPGLKYLYPPPSSGILTNITHALLSVPKFYVQVLHLMNKMNLPSPFGPVTTRPPMFEMHSGPVQPMPPPFPPEYPPLPEEEMEFSSEEESEYDSGDDEGKERMVRLMGLINQPCKRPQRTKASSRRKKPKIKDLLFVPKPDSQSAPGPALQPSDVFEQPQPCEQKKIHFHISTAVASSLEEPPQAPEVRPTEESAAEADAASGELGDGFGKIYPASQVLAQVDDSEEDEDVISDFISRKELEKGRLSRDEIRRMSVFKNYEPGDPTCRLYVKNIAKQVEEKDLKYIYGKYIDISSEAEKNMFDIVLMKDGRMKGQAFIGLPSEKSAEKALKDTNGYILYDKPLVVQFARSARPKLDATDSKKGPKRRC